MARYLVAALVTVWVGCGGDDPEQCYAPDLSATGICDLLGDACAPAAEAAPAITGLIQVAPSADLPPEVESMDSHNNLDIIWHENRLFFAFRTAPNHFASDEAMIYVVSTPDQQTWTLEASYHLFSDLREPRFLVVDGKLFMYFAVLGYVAATFDPQYSMVTERTGPCEWTEAEQIFEPTFIPWRTHSYDGTAYLLGYVGGENIYGPDGEPVRVQWLTTDDGRNFDPVVPGQPMVLEGGSSETDFVFADDGAVIAVSRNELGDELGWGSKICRAEPGDFGNWSCVGDPKKYDSPFMFKHGSDIYLVARRQVANDGDYDLMRRDLSPREQTSMYNRAYWLTPKRCSLWKVDPDALSVEHVLDLPSAGDTCFPSVVQLTADEYLIYNYTSPVDEPDTRWVDGQLNPTSIYRVTLSL